MKAKQIGRDIESKPTKGALIPAVAYARVSSKEQEREGYSIPVQLKRVHEYAERHGFAIVAEYVDVETAKEPGRREFSKMVEAARHDATIGAIICEKVDRLCRNLRDYLTIDELPARTLFWQQDFPDNAAGKLSFGMMVLLAKHYIDNLSDEVKKGMAEKVQEGGFPHQAPLGYRNAREGDRQVIAPDPIKAPMVRRAYELYATRGYSLKTLRKKLRDEGLATTKQGKLISLSQLQWLLKNPFYYGAFRWKGRTWAGSHQSLISRELWDTVQAAFSAHEKPVYRKHDFAYKALLICGSCGRHLTAEIKKQRYVYYHCAGEEACRKTYIREEQLDEQVRALLASIAIPDHAKAWLLQGISKKPRGTARLSPDGCSRNPHGDQRARDPDGSPLRRSPSPPDLRRLLSTAMGPARGKAEPVEPRPGPTPARRRRLHGARQQAHRTDRPSAANIRASRYRTTTRAGGSADIEPRPEGQNAGL